MNPQIDFATVFGTPFYQLADASNGAGKPCIQIPCGPSIVPETQEASATEAAEAECTCLAVVES